MTARPWGTTGRVTLDGPIDSRSLPNVQVDGEWVGWLYTPDDDHPAWGARTGVGQLGEHDDLPSLDHAVMWVLRRAATDVWRQERGEVRYVWRSRSFNPGKWVTEWRDGGLPRVLSSDTYAEALAAALGPTP